MLKVIQQDMNVRKRDGRVLSFDRNLIRDAMQKAFCAQQQVEDPTGLGPEILDKIELMTSNVKEQVTELAMRNEGVTVEHIQDVVEKELMRGEFYEVARRYILYRAEHAKIVSSS